MGHPRASERASCGGSFSGYLFETFGIEKFKQLYPLTDPAGSAETMLGKSFEAIGTDGRPFLKGRD